MPDFMSCDIVYSHVVIKVFETFIKLKTIHCFADPSGIDRRGNLVKTFSNSFPFG